MAKTTIMPTKTTVKSTKKAIMKSMKQPHMHKLDKPGDIHREHMMIWLKNHKNQGYKEMKQQFLQPKGQVMQNWREFFRALGIQDNQVPTNQFLNRISTWSRKVLCQNAGAKKYANVQIQNDSHNQLSIQVGKRRVQKGIDLNNTTIKQQYEYSLNWLATQNTYSLEDLKQAGFVRCIVNDDKKKPLGKNEGFKLFNIWTDQALGWSKSEVVTKVNKGLTECADDSARNTLKRELGNATQFLRTELEQAIKNKDKILTEIVTRNLLIEKMEAVNTKPRLIGDEHITDNIVQAYFKADQIKSEERNIRNTMEFKLMQAQFCKKSILLEQEVTQLKAALDSSRRERTQLNQRVGCAVTLADRYKGMYNGLVPEFNQAKQELGQLRIERSTQNLVINALQQSHHTLMMENQLLGMDLEQETDTIYDTNGSDIFQSEVGAEVRNHDSVLHLSGPAMVRIQAFLARPDEGREEWDQMQLSLQHESNTQ